MWRPQPTANSQQPIAKSPARPQTTAQPQLLFLFVTISLATTIQVASTHLTRGRRTAALHVALWYATTSLVTTSMQPPMQPLLTTTKATTTSSPMLSHLRGPPLTMQPLFVTTSLATTIQVASTHLTRGL